MMTLSSQIEEKAKNASANNADTPNSSTSVDGVERSRELNNDERNRIIGRWQAGQSRHEISRQTGASTSTISRLITKFEKTGQVSNLPRKGRPLQLLQSDRDALIELGNSRKPKGWTFKQLMDTYEQLGHPSIKKDNARRILKIAQIKLLKEKPGVKKKQRRKSKNNTVQESAETEITSNDVQEGQAVVHANGTI